MKCSNSFSLSAAITSAGWIVFFPSSWAYSFELMENLVSILMEYRTRFGEIDGELTSISSTYWRLVIKLTWTRGNSQIQYSSYSTPTKHPCG
jgi:hypothetical protein